MSEEASQTFLLFDSACHVCSQLAREVERETDGVLLAHSLREPEMQGLLDRARPAWRWEPTLLEVDGDRPRAFTGLGMALRLVRILGLRRAGRVARLVQRAPVPTAQMHEERRWFLRYSGGMLLTLLGSSILAACGGSTSSPSPTPTASSLQPTVGQTFVGKLNNSNAFIGLVLNAGSGSNAAVTAYVCDGTDTHISLSQWFTGTVSGNIVNLKAKNGAQLQATLTANSATGTFTTASGTAFASAASQVPNVTHSDFGTGKAGLFRAMPTLNGVQYLQGWIFLPDGEVRGGSKNLSTNALSTAPVSKSCCIYCCAP